MNHAQPVRRSMITPRCLQGKLIGWQSWLRQSIIFSAFFAFMELFFHITEEMSITGRFVYPVLFSIPIGFFFASLVSFFSCRVNCILSTVIFSTTGVWFCTQIVYARVFQTYMDLSKISLAGQVAEDHGTDTKDAIFDSMPKIIAVALIIAFFSLLLFVFLKPKKKTPILCGCGIFVCLILHLLCRIFLLCGGAGEFSPNGIYNQYPRTLDNNIENFGVMTSLRLELHDFIFPGSHSDAPSFDTFNDDILHKNVDTDSPQDTEPPVDTDVETDIDNPVTPKPPKTQNILDIDVNSMIENETDKNLKKIHQYIQSQTGSYTNEYTGYFEGKNLIMICAESFTKHMIDKDITPTLYELSNGGFVFNNFYGMMKSITTNGEYAFCTGLIPKTNGDVDDLKKNSTFVASIGKYLPYAMGNVFSDMGATAYAYHNNTGSYYQRNKTHPNLGYTMCRFMDGAYDQNGNLDESRKFVYSTGKEKPNSDYEMVKQALPDFLNIKNSDGSVKQFTAYFMTYSGHHPYWDINDSSHTKSPMVYFNRDIVDKLDYTGRTKSYLAANLELENMLTEIVRQLKENGCYEDTVIVLTNDHYPYGLYDSEYRELAKGYVDPNFGIYQNSFICFCAGMEPVTVDTPCCTVDILPTLLNLFGVDYDSRLLAGTDILDPKSFHIAMLYNKNFITDSVKYIASKDKITYLVNKSDVPSGYVDACISYVKNRFEISLQILNNDYYRVFYDAYRTQHENDNAA